MTKTTTDADFSDLPPTLRAERHGAVAVLKLARPEKHNALDDGTVAGIEAFFTDWADRFPAIVAAAHRIKAASFLIDGEVVIVRDYGTPDFHALRSRRRGSEAVLFAFDLIEQDGDDLRDRPLIERKRRLNKLIGRAKHAIRFTEHLAGDGLTVFDHVCRMGLEGIVSKRTDAPYRSGLSKTWLKSKNPSSDAVRREREEEWH